MSRSHAACPDTKPDRRLSCCVTTAAMLFAIALSGCAQSRGPTTQSFNDPQRLSATPRRVHPDDDVERPAPVPVDPYKGVRYNGGRDPVTGVAGTLNGSQPAAAGGITPGARPIGRVAQDATTNVTAEGTVVEVKPGDTLFAIAQRHRVTVAGLMKVNNLASEKIAPGQRLLLP